MPRPRKYRRGCCLPQSNLYGPIGQVIDEENIIPMTVGEYETIRLIDFEEMTQQECADSMNVARTTIQRIYTDARKKLSDSLVNGKIIKIEGGDYTLYRPEDRAYGGRRCRRHRNGQGNMQNR